MSLATTCALLGWELCEADGPGFLGYHPQPGDVCVWPRGERFSVAVWQGVQGDPARTYEVSRAAFDLAALLELRGVQALDWPCEECEGTREQVKTDGHVGEPGWTLRLSTAVAVELWRPCPACTIDGKPTGRRKAAAFEAVLMGEPWNDDGLHEDLHESLQSPGHEGARAALRQIAEGWEALAEGMPERSAEVMLDRAEARGDASARGLLFAYPPQGQPYAAPCPELGAWVLAWLAGEIECEPCARATPGGPSVRGCPHPHPGTRRVAVDAHLGAIRVHLAEAWQGATVECKDCYGIGGWEHPTTPVLDPCTACAGLGRVKPQPEAA